MSTLKTNYTIALAGQPNTGKSTIFNRLTGGHQHVGNWPGKTVEKKGGSFHFNDKQFELIDLPGTYSLTSNSMEEKVTRDFLVNEKPDVVVAVVDASQLERTLYMLSEIILFPVKIILVLNMMDVATANGVNLDVGNLQKELGIKVIPMAASKNQGMPELLEAIDSECSSKKEPVKNNPNLKWQTGDLTAEIEAGIAGKVNAPYPEKWLALKLLEEDSDICELVENELEPAAWDNVKESLKKSQGGGTLLAAGERYSWINSILSSSLQWTGQSKKTGRRHKFDSLATHPLWGKILAVLILMLTFIATFLLCMPVIKFLLGSMANISGLLKSSLAGQPQWVASMIGDGLVPGLGISMVMISFLLPLFFIIGFLEDVGYIARLSYVFDGFMNRLGLHGKSFMSFLLSFSCNISGVMGSRVIDSWKQRLITIIMTSIIPCGAVWGVIGLMIVIFFNTNTVLVVSCLFLAMIIQLMITSMLMRRFLPDEDYTGLIMELPPYHKPNFRTIFIYTWTFAKGFIKRGFTLIAGVSFFVWLLSYFPNGNIETSFLSTIGHGLDPIGSLMGMDWRLIVALIAAVASKEAALASLAVIYGIGSGVTSITQIYSTKVGFEHSALGEALLHSIGPATALAFIFAFFFSIPCVGTLGVIYSETKSIKWTVGSACYYTFTSLAFGVIAYNVGLIIF